MKSIAESLMHRNDSACGIDHVHHGGIASVVGVARLLGLTQSQIIEAINIMVPQYRSEPDTHRQRFELEKAAHMRLPTAMRFSRRSWRHAG